MSRSNSPILDPIVVLGSKPGAPLPNIKTPVVIGANGAVELALPYRQKYGSRIVGMVPLAELKKHEHIRNSFIKAKPDEIIILGDEEGDAFAFIQNNLGLHPAKITVWDFHEVNWKLAKLFGWRKFLIMLESIQTRGLQHLWSEVLPDIFGKRDMIWMGRSTGLNAILHALERFPASQIITAGIGLVAGGHFNQVGVFTSKTAKSDQIAFKHWPYHKRVRVCTTDDMMSIIGNVPKWHGNYF